MFSLIGKPSRPAPSGCHKIETLTMQAITGYDGAKVSHLKTFLPLSSRFVYNDTATMLQCRRNRFFNVSVR